MRETSSLASPPVSGASSVVRELIARAESAAAEGQTAEARLAFQAALVADDTPLARLAFASFLCGQSELATAELHLRQALDLANARGRDDERCDCCLALSQVTAQRGDHHGSSVWLQRAVRWRLAFVGELSAELLLALGQAAIRAGDLGEARNILQRAELLACDGEQPLILMHLALVDQLEGDQAAALSRLTESQRLFRAAGDAVGVAYSLINSGHILSNADRLQSSERCFRLAARLFDSLEQPRRLQRSIAFAREAHCLSAIQSEAYQSN